MTAHLGVVLGLRTEREAALMHAGRLRHRPILMTPFALIAGRLLVAIGLGEGAEFYRPLAIAIIGGTVLLCARRANLNTQARQRNPAIRVAATSGFITSMPSFIGKELSTGAINSFLVAPTSVAAR